MKYKKLIIILILILLVVFSFILFRRTRYTKTSLYIIKKEELGCDLENSLYVIKYPIITQHESKVVLPEFKGSDFFIKSMYRILYDTSINKNEFYVIGRLSTKPHNIDYYGCTGSHSLLIEAFIDSSTFECFKK